jgi:hypothetical protein
MNRFNQAQQSEFMNTYVAPPLEMMHEVLKHKQQQYDYQKALGKAANDQLTGLSVYGEAATSHLTGVQGKFQSVLEELKGKDLLDPTNQKKLDEAINSISKDKDLATHVSANKKISEYMDNKGKLIAENGLVDANVYAYEKALQQYAKTGQVSGILSQTNIPKGVDRFKELNKFYSMLKPDSSEGVSYLSGTSGDTHGNIAYETKTSGISRRKTSQTTEDILQLAAADPVGQELFREHEMYMDMQGKESTYEGKMQYLREQLMSVGKQHEYVNQSSGLAAALNTKRTEKREEGFSLPGITTQAEGMPSSLTSSFKYTKDGKIVIDNEADLSTKFGKAINALMTSDSNNMIHNTIKAWNTAKAPIDKKVAQEVIAIKHASKSMGLTEKEIVERGSMPVHFEYQGFNNKERENYTKYMLDGGISNLANFGVYNPKNQKNEEAAQSILESIKRQMPDAEGVDDLTPASVFGFIDKNKIPLSMVGRANSGNPISPALVQMRLGGEAVYIDLTSGNDPKMVQQLVQQGHITEQDIYNTKDAKLHYYGYISDVKEKDGKKQLQIYHLEKSKDEQGNIVEKASEKPKYIPLSN